MWKGRETVRHEDDTGKSALYSNNCSYYFFVMFRNPALDMGAGARSPKGVRC